MEANYPAPNTIRKERDITRVLYVTIHILFESMEGGVCVHTH